MGCAHRRDTDRIPTRYSPLIETAIRHGQVRRAVEPAVSAGNPDRTGFSEGLIRVVEPTGRVSPARELITHSGHARPGARSPVSRGNTGAHPSPIDPICGSRSTGRPAPSAMGAGRAAATGRARPTPPSPATGPRASSIIFNSISKIGGRFSAGSRVIPISGCCIPRCWHRTSGRIVTVAGSAGRSAVAATESMRYDVRDRVPRTHQSRRRPE